MTDQSPPTSNDRWLTRAEAAARLRVSPRTIDRYAHRGHITRLKTPTGLVRFRAEDVEGLVRERTA